MTISTRPATRASTDKFGPSRTPTSIPTGPGRPGEAFTEKSARACGTAPGTATSTSKPARGTMTRSVTAAAHFKACSPWSIAFMFTAWGLARAGFSIPRVNSPGRSEDGPRLVLGWRGSRETGVVHAGLLREGRYGDCAY